MRPPLATAEGNCLFLDLDHLLSGALETAGAGSGGPAGFLVRLRDHFGGAVALVSGRTIQEIDRMVAPAHLAAIGLDGIERRYDHIVEIDRQPADPSIDTLRGRIIASDVLSKGVWMEDRGGVLAIHYASAPDRETAVLAVLEDAAADLPEIRLVRGGLVVRGTSRATGRGRALAQFMQNPPFRNRLPVFVGSGGSDDDGFGVAQDLGGCGIAVGAERSRATYHLADVAAMTDWLMAIVPPAPTAG